MFWTIVIIIIIIIFVLAFLAHYSFESLKTDLSKQYGEITKTINPEDSVDIDKCIFVFDESKKIWLFGNIFDYKDIKGCSVSESETVHKADVTYKTKTSTGSLLGRALIGGMIKGIDGAAIGAASATKKTEVIRNGADYVSVYYIVTIYINSIKSPVIYVPCGNNYYMKEEIVGIIDVITSQNKDK